MMLPQFFIVGAPKSGTTAMTHYLDAHPQVSCRGVGGAHFATDLDFRTNRLSREEYAACFSDCSHAEARGETSVWYLYSRCAAANIAAANPEARIIIMLRNPVEMIPSQHSQFLFNRNEDVKDLAQALALEGERRNGRQIPKRAHFPEGLQYTAVASYADQVERFLANFPKDQVHIILHEDLKRDTERCFREVCEFLGVDSSFLPDLRVVNPNKELRSGVVFDVLGARSGLIRVLSKCIPQRVRQGLARVLKRWNTRYTRRAPAPIAVVNDLRNRFAEENRRLASLISRDLSHWSAK